MTVPNVIGGQPITAEWGNAVADAINEFSGVQSVHPGYTSWTPSSNRYRALLPGWNGSAFSTSVPLTYRAQYWPIIVQESQVLFQGVGMQVQTAGTGDRYQVRPGLAACDDEWRITSLRKDWGIVNVSTSGRKIVTHAPEALTTGRYYLMLYWAGSTGTIALNAAPMTQFPWWYVAINSKPNELGLHNSIANTVGAFPDPPLEPDTGDLADRACPLYLIGADTL